ncbi:MAG: hypothetical protein ABI273_14325 [Lacunisphaera sp.]
MKAIIRTAEFATVASLFAFKKRGLPLKPFPGYTDDQWGIKAHNRPWISFTGRFFQGEKIIEIGGTDSYPRAMSPSHILWMDFLSWLSSSG